MTHPGDMSATAANGPYTHRLRNLGPATFEVVDVELLHRPKGPSEEAARTVAAPSLAQIFARFQHPSGKASVTLASGEVPSAYAYEWTLEPGGTTPMHTHERPHLILAVTRMRLKMTNPDGRSITHDVRPGDFHWVDTKVTHSLTNTGAAEGKIVEIELR
jgi:beta-alanine degradation protein BauB